jgi:hypothetical protein
MNLTGKPRRDAEQDTPSPVSGNDYSGADVWRGNPSGRQSTGE